MSGVEHDNMVPADLADIAGALDALGATEREGAPAGMAARVFENTRGMLGAAPASLPFPTVTVTRRRFFTSMRMAAAVAICGATVALWLGQAGPRVTALNGNLEDDVDVMLALRSMGSVGERIDLLFSDTAAVRESLKSIGDNLPEGDAM